MDQKLKQEELTAENEKLAKALADKRLRMSKAGNIAEAALEIHNVMQAAQDAATHYLEEMRLRCDEEYQQTLKKAKDDAAAIVAKAKQDAAEIIMKANNANSDYDPVVETILKEWKQPN